MAAPAPRKSNQKGSSAMANQNVVEFTNGDQPGVRLTRAAAARAAEPASASRPMLTAKAVRGKTGKKTGKQR